MSLTLTFRKKVLFLERIRVKFETLLNRGEILNDDIQQAYCGLYLDLFTEFEALLEQLFFGLLEGNYYSSDMLVKKRIKVQPSTMFSEIVFHKRSYLDWLPYSDHTIPRAKLFLDNGYPFTKLSKPQIDRLDDLHKIRNAIAHKSKKAEKDFNNVIINLTLLPSERKPAGFLRSIPSSAAGNTQYEIASGDLLLYSNLLCT
ncbi:MAG: hypothetical protein FJ266_14525 [Planctomycetes bacterium]|nr:hypothetical protein [Planctomycetota bacterium]